MLAIERREYILNRLRKEGRVQVRELSQELGVSHMTIHRDLDYLSTQDDRVKKVFGGAIMERPYPPEVGKCAMCGKPVPTRTAISLQTFSGERLEACCAHCGLLLLETRDDIVSGMATDYILERVVNLKAAVFLIESDVVVCCSPSVLCFGDEEHARRFQQGFGGEIADLDEAKKQVVFHMTLS
ncbi:MAG TPA: DeoR family transcriptional regulator [Anaerolineae bacterium]|nr:DeoR family transcriptional regulator [Anaerolineae bacterium]